MSEPSWIPLGGVVGDVDYRGVWNGVDSYEPGNVVRHNGIDYLAVNPSTGQTPPASSSFRPAVGIGTSLPTAPYDGQEFDLVDSLTAPTFSWRFRYVASIADAYKWLCVGPAELRSDGSAGGALLNTLTSIGAGYFYHLGWSVIVPRAGIYDVAGWIQVDNNSDGNYNNVLFHVANVGTGSALAEFPWSPAAGTWAPISFDARLTAGAGQRVGIAAHSGAGGKKAGLGAIRVRPLRVA